MLPGAAWTNGPASVAWTGMNSAAKRNASRHTRVALMVAAAVGIGGGVYCYFFHQFWTHVETAGLLHLTEYRSPNVLGHRGSQILVHREFLAAMRRLDDYARASGVKIVVIQSYRHPGAVLRGEKVPPSPYSNHMAGHALDVNIRCGWTLFEFADLGKASLSLLPESVQRLVDRIRNDGKLRWGGDFTEEDPIHVDDGLNLRNRQEWERHREGCLHDAGSARPKWRRWLHL